MDAYLSGTIGCIVFARSENEAVEVLSHIAGRKLFNNGKYFFKSLPLDEKARRIIGDSKKAGYIMPHNVENSPENKCSQGTFLHYYCDKYEPTFIEVETRLSILNESIDNNN